MADRLLTPQEAAARLTISEITLKDWLRAGRVPGVKVGKLWRVRESDLEKYVADLGRASKEPAAGLAENLGTFDPKY